MTQKHLSADAFKRYKELNPERFAELERIAKQQIDNSQGLPKSRREIAQVLANKSGYSQLQIEELLSDKFPNRKHYLITTSDGHTYFETAVSLESAVTRAEERHPNFYGQVTNVEELP